MQVQNFLLPIVVGPGFRSTFPDFKSRVAMTTKRNAIETTLPESLFSVLQSKLTTQAEAELEVRDTAPDTT